MTKCFVKFQVRTNISFPLNFIYNVYFKASDILLKLSLGTVAKLSLDYDSFFVLTTSF